MRRSPSGRIVEADRDKWVQEISRAYSLQDIAVQLGELAGPTPTPTPASSTPPVVPAYAAAPVGTPTPAVPYRPGADEAAATATRTETVRSGRSIAA